MLASQRRAAILAIVEETGAIRVSELVEQLGVSDMTVRRDIERLDGDGLLERVHGGAMAILPRATDEPGFTAKSGLMTAAKLLHESPGADHVVVLTGGVRTPSDALVGPVAIAALRGLHVDRLFLGAHGIDRAAGLTTPNLVEAETNRALVAASRSVSVLADHTKVGIVGLSTFMQLSEVDTLITDSGITARARAVLEESVDHIVLADSSVSTPGSSRGVVRAGDAG